MTNEINIIIEDIKYYIKQNNVIKDDKLPSERSLADLFSTSRFLVRKALKSLVESNYLYVKDKSGYFLAEDKIDLDLTNILDLFNNERFSHQLILTKKIKASRSLANKLEVEIQTNLFQTIFLFKLSHEHFILMNTFLLVRDIELNDDIIEKTIKDIFKNAKEKKGKIFLKQPDDFEQQLLITEYNNKICKWVSNYEFSDYKLYVENSMNILPYNFLGW